MIFYTLVHDAVIPGSPEGQAVLKEQKLLERTVQAQLERLERFKQYGSGTEQFTGRKAITWASYQSEIDNPVGRSWTRGNRGYDFNDKLSQFRRDDITSRWIKRNERRLPPVGNRVKSPQAKYSDTSSENICIKESASIRSHRANTKVVKNAAKIRHTSETQKIHQQAAQGQIKQPQSYTEKHMPERSMKEKVKTSALRSNIDVSKKKATTTANNAPGIKHMNKKIKIGKTWSKMAVGLGIALGLSYLSSKMMGTSNIALPSSNPVTFDARSSAYLPEKYSRGYDTMKETMTPFGSSTMLSKTKMSLNHMKTSQRKGMVKTTRGILKSAIPFKLSDGAIGHMRY